MPSIFFSSFVHREMWRRPWDCILRKASGCLLRRKALCLYSKWVNKMKIFYLFLGGRDFNSSWQSALNMLVTGMVQKFFLELWTSTSSSDEKILFGTIPILYIELFLPNVILALSHMQNSSPSLRFAPTQLCFVKVW